MDGAGAGAGGIPLSTGYGSPGTGTKWMMNS